MNDYKIRTTNSFFNFKGYIRKAISMKENLWSVAPNGSSLIDREATELKKSSDLSLLRRRSPNYLAIIFVFVKNKYVPRITNEYVSLPITIFLFCVSVFFFFIIITIIIIIVIIIKLGM